MNRSSPVIYHLGDDPEMLRASARARETFRHFFHCVSEDFNRIVPACELACVKTAFCDDFADPDSDLEHMWIEQVDFDGVNLTGVLINSPNKLRSAQAGDDVEFPLSRLDDWLCVIDDVVYGGFTIQVIRSRMDVDERQRHDQAWELSFPEPETVNVPSTCDAFEEMIASALADQIATAPSTVDEVFDGGRTLLHMASLFGREKSVHVLLQNKADVDAICDRGWTAYDYAQSLGWTDVMKLLGRAGN
ncbi:Ankyrin repeats (3 copies) [Stieleria maiorica]|uniref:Ankyrin repeats (3 copies) n=1 Tax=Stieleria maiorica TaxID=2795974 RepID=A0A5B9ME58_9BACT|nr:DUF2314 domain-containing protein [Stieleria maiorica]QEF98260.1 Ankyrin repeats (3 copies) [Stieleria maiorica]